jgi:hypothetical protein
MPFQILFALAVVAAIFVVLRAALRLLTQPNPLVHDAISLMRWLILILVSLTGIPIRSRCVAGYLEVRVGNISGSLFK